MPFLRALKQLIVGALLCNVYSLSFAGYFITVTYNMNVPGISAGMISQCQSTIGGAVQSITPYSLTITSLSVSAVSAKRTNAPAAYFNANVTSCNTQTGYYPSATLDSGVYDPSLQGSVTFEQLSAQVDSLQNSVAYLSAKVANFEVTLVNGTGGTGTTVPVVTEPAFDVLKASAIFSFFFSFVMGTWFVTKNIGQILSAVKRW